MIDPPGRMVGMPISVLVVDDIDANRSLVRRVIERRIPGSRVTEAGNGAEALRMVQEDAPDMMVLDVLMPDINGFEVCRRIKAEEATRSILILMVSGHLTDTDSRISGLESGADSYLCKPFENDELVAQLVAFQRILMTERALLAEQKRLRAELEHRKVIERQLEKAKCVAEEAARAKSEFLAHMSHEIRTPMNAVIGMTEILLGSSLLPEQKEYVKTINTAGETLLMVINDILDHTKIESGKLTLEQRPFRVNELIADGISMVQNQADAKKLRLRAEIAPDVPLNVAGDVIRLRQILSNLLSNAVKFTEQGEVTVMVTSCRLDHGMCEINIAVRDTGIGMPASRMNRLFQPFTQIDESTTRRFGGTGLGLTISKRLAEMMGGGIRVESEEGKGSIFHVQVRLPYERTAPGPGAALAGHRIMILDDNPVDRRFLARQLEGWGLTFVQAVSGEDALTQLSGGGLPDLALVDMRMPGVDGVEFARRVREHPAWKRLPLLLISAENLEGAAIDHMIDRLFSARLQKPVSPAALFDAMQAHLRGQPGVPPPPPPPETEPEKPALRVLVAEDNPVNRKVVEYMLKRLGYRSDFAEDGRAAVAAARENTYDLILMDVQMPHMDGVEAMKAIRRECGAAGTTPPFFVALTAHAMQGDREKYIAEGMDDYVSKPVREKELSRVIDLCAASRAGEVGAGA